MSAQAPAQKITLEEIAERKKKLLNEIHVQKKAMTATTREIFAPLAPATNKADAIMRSFNTGMADIRWGGNGNQDYEEDTCILQEYEIK